MIRLLILVIGLILIPYVGNSAYYYDSSYMGYMYYPYISTMDNNDDKYEDTYYNPYFVLVVIIFMTIGTLYTIYNYLKTKNG